MLKCICKRSLPLFDLLFQTFYCPPTTDYAQERLRLTDDTAAVNNAAESLLELIEKFSQQPHHSRYPLILCCIKSITQYFHHKIYIKNGKINFTNLITYFTCVLPVTVYHITCILIANRECTFSSPERHSNAHQILAGNGSFLTI